MIPPSILGSFSAEWLRAVPPQTLGNVITYLMDSFSDLRHLYPTQHDFGKSEPVLTLSLSQHADLQDRKEGAGISGGFAAESYAPVRDSSGAVRKNGRTDILFTLGERGAPQVIFEFKKLDGSAGHRRLYITDGLNRFVTGKYAPDRGQGVMVGLSKLMPATESVAVQRAINDNTVLAAQRCVPNAAGVGTHVPSILAAGVADFDTIHDRSGSTMITPIRVAHVFVHCP